MTPQAAFDRYFADFGANEANLAQRRQRRTRLLDRVARDIARFQASLPREQRPRLEAHLEAIHAIEAEIDGNMNQACDPRSPTFGQDAGSNAAVPTTLKGLTDIMVRLLACGVTHVGSMQFGAARAHFTSPTWPEAGININATVHEGIAHPYWGGGWPTALRWSRG